MEPYFAYGRTSYYHADCFDWLDCRKTHSIHGVVTDPPFGLEYSERELNLKRNGNRGGVWRLPPAFDGYERRPLPRFTVLSKRELEEIEEFFFEWARHLFRPLVPGAHVLVATTPLLSHMVSMTIEDAGFERRGEVIRLVRTMRGGDRPKGAHDEFAEVSVIPKAMHEPWLLFRKPLDGRIRDNLGRWWTGGLRRPERDRPFGDVVLSGRAPDREKVIAPHASLKPQAFLRQVVRAILPLGKGVVVDTFAGSGSTLAAAAAVGYRATGIDNDETSAAMARAAVPGLSKVAVTTPISEISEIAKGNGRANGHKPRNAKRAGVLLPPVQGVDTLRKPGRRGRA